MARLKIFHLQNGVIASGSAVFRNHSKMRELGIDSEIFCSSSQITDPYIHTISILRKNIFKIQNLIFEKFYSLILPKQATFSYGGYWGINFSLGRLKNADIIVIHWTQGGFLSIRFLNKVFKLNKPIYVFCHDFNYITAGCHIPLDCDKYISGCKNCPLIEQDRFNIFKRFYSYKKKVFQQHRNVKFVAPSSWMKDNISQSAIGRGKDVIIVPSASDKKIFYIQDKKRSRDYFGLPANKRLILFGASNPNNKLKGIDFLIEALQKMSNQLVDVELVIFGKKENFCFDRKIDLKIHLLGKIYSEYEMAQLYSACDIYVSPSLSETFGQTILESIMCKTPVIAFNYSGVKDIIDHMVNGYLADYKDSNSIANGIMFLLENSLPMTYNENLEINTSILKFVEYLTLKEHKN